MCNRNAIYVQKSRGDIMKPGRKVLILLIVWFCLMIPLLFSSISYVFSMRNVGETGGIIGINEILMVAATAFVLIPLQIWIIHSANKAKIKAIKIIFTILTIHLVCSSILLSVAFVIIARL